jgi:hypothetical protein
MQLEIYLHYAVELREIHLCFVRTPQEYHRRVNDILLSALISAVLPYDDL